MKMQIYEFKKVTSTNDMAISLIKKQNKKTGCVYAEVQTNGRGTYGKKWISYKGNLFTSIFFPIKKNFPPMRDFIMINSILITGIFKNIFHIKNVKIKLPNDILIKKRKICGILQEVITFKKKKFLIIGIGINIKFNPLINKYKTTSLKKETKKNHEIKKIVNLIILSYKSFFKNLSFYEYNKYKKKADQITLK